MPTAQVITVGTSTSVQSAAVASTKVRVTANAAVHYQVGASPVAYTGNCEIISANSVRYINMEGLNNKIAVLGSSQVAEVSVVAIGTVATTARYA